MFFILLPCHFLLSLSDACPTSLQQMQQRSLRIRIRIKISRIRNTGVKVTTQEYKKNFEEHTPT